MKRKRMEKGHIAERGPDRYLVRWRTKDTAGKNRQLSKIVVGDYGKALTFLSEKLNPSSGVEPEIPERTFKSYMETEWARYTREHWKASTMITQGSFVKRHIAPYFETMPLSTIKPATIEAFHAAMEVKGLGRKTRRNLHAILATMFTYAVDELELIERNPVKKGLAPKLEKTEKPALTETQLSSCRLVPIRYKAFFMTLALTGVRTGEALGLKWADVDFASHELNIRRAIYRGKETTPKTSSSIRPRPMMPELCRARYTTRRWPSTRRERTSCSLRAAVGR